MGRGGILRSPSAHCSGHHVKFKIPQERRRVSCEAPLSGFSDAGSHSPEVEEESPRERLQFLTDSATLASVRRRISKKTGIESDLLRGVCVHGQLRMYAACGYDEKILAGPAVREEREARDLRKMLHVHERGTFKGGLALVIARVVDMRYSTVMNANTREFRELAVRAVRIKATRKK